MAVEEHKRSPAPSGWECVLGDNQSEKIDAKFFVSGLILPELLTEPDGTKNGVTIGRRKDNGM